MSRGFLLDTNVPSELTRPQPSPRVTQWLEDTDDELMHISVITIGEVCKGITVHPEAHRRDWLRQWLENEVRPWFAGRILPVYRGDFGTLGNSRRRVPVERHRLQRSLGIPVNLNAHSGRNPNGIPGRFRTPSERSDAGISIVQEVFGFVKRNLSGAKRRKNTASRERGAGKGAAVLVPASAHSDPEARRALRPELSSVAKVTP